MMLRRLVSICRAGAVAWITTGLLCGVAVGMVTIWATQIRNPVEMVNQMQAGRARIVNGLLVVDFDLIRRGDCNSESAAWIWRWEETPDRGRRRYVIPLGGNPVTMADAGPFLQRFTVARPLPRGLSPGAWLLKYRYLDHCGLFPGLQEPTKRETADIPITITAADLAPPP